MQKIPSFTASTIQLTLSVSEYKILCICFEAFEHLININSSDESFRVLAAKAEIAFGFKFPQDCLQNVEVLKTSFGYVIDKVTEAYVIHRAGFVELASLDLHDYAVKNFEPDILNLADGQMLKVQL